MYRRMGLLGLASLHCFAQTAPPQPLASSTPEEKSWNRVPRGEPFVPLTPEERLQFLWKRVVFSPGAPFRIAFQAALDQRRNYPKSWGQGADAYGYRVLNRWARIGVRNGLETASAAALGYEVRYIPCNCDSIPRRVVHSLAMNFVTYNRHGHWVFNSPRVGSTIAAQYIGMSWLPHGTHTTAGVSRGLGTHLAVGSVVNVWREFSPPLMRRVRTKLPFAD